MNKKKIKSRALWFDVATSKLFLNEVATPCKETSERDPQKELRGYGLTPHLCKVGYRPTVHQEQTLYITLSRRNSEMEA